MATVLAKNIRKGDRVYVSEVVSQAQIPLYKALGDAWQRLDGTIQVSVEYPDGARDTRWWPDPETPVHQVNI